MTTKRQVLQQLQDRYGAQWLAMDRDAKAKAFQDRARELRAAGNKVKCENPWRKQYRGAV